MQHPNLITERLELRLVRPEDAAFILQGLSDRHVTEYYAVHYDTPEAVQEQMKFSDDLVQNGTGAWWAFSLKGEGELMGACGLSSLEEEHQKAEIGFWLLPEHWGKGYTPEAAQAVLDYAFSQMRLNCIEAIVEGGNGASEKVLQKLGFTCEGRLREREMKNGRFIDLIYYSILKRDRQEKAEIQARLSR
ncbi:GNAT family N-acetyltransferase [Pontibacter roseus]|uniref:GNAT family N-acetyltransferase n=1 Tax=Pontibacter roseus TaxID=336989 RepID=UPI0003801190|nr:GNAT family protein [Pontibacter roseus]